MTKTPPPKLTIVVTVFNVELYLENTLKSIHQQDCTDLEVICIDDNSLDGSWEIIEKYLKKDNRFSAIHHNQNLGTHISRLDGMKAAKGDYVWIIDGDDALIIDACACILKELTKSPVDILHIGSIVYNENELNDTRINNMVRFVKPLRGTLCGAEVFNECFIKENYHFNIWNKIISINVIRDSIPSMERIYLPKGQDEYEYFILSYYAKTYRGQPNILGYEYHFGRGISGHNQLTQNQYFIYCKMADTALAIERFSLNKPDYVCKAAKICHNNLLEDTVHNLYRIETKAKSAGYDKLINSWCPDEVVSKLAELSWFNQGNVINVVNESSTLSKNNRIIKTIATYYHRLSNGGIQRIIPELLLIWKNLGYNVILITDENPSDKDYPIPTGIKRIVIQNYSNTDKNNYKIRAKQISKIIHEYNVDLIVYHAWISNLLLWDLLIYKSYGIKFLIYTHNIFPLLMGSAFTFYASLPGIYRLADGVITLNKTDTLFWQNFNNNAFEVNNPLTLKPSLVKPAPLDSHNILWIGRMSPEKRPEEAIKIFKQVHIKLPDSKLIMVGDGFKQVINKLKNIAIKDNILESIIFVGYDKEVLKYYLKSSVFLSTSEYEGYMLTLAESLVAGVPVVMYDLPYLTLVKDGAGIVSVPQNDYHGACSEICKILTDYNYRSRLGINCRLQAEKLENIDLSSKWNEIIKLLEKNDREKIYDRENDLMWDTMMQFYCNGINKKNQEIVAIHNHLLYKIGRFMLNIYHKLTQKT